jgi:hypothetical protein
MLHNGKCLCSCVINRWLYDHEEPWPPVRQMPILLCYLTYASISLIYTVVNYFLLLPATSLFF